MINIVEPQIIEDLTLFYKKLSDNLMRNKKSLIQNSCLFRLLKVKSNVRMRILDASVLSRYIINPDRLKSLISD